MFAGPCGIHALLRLYRPRARFRYLGYKNNVAPELIRTPAVRELLQNHPLNVTPVGELAAKISKDVDFINIDPSAIHPNQWAKVQFL